MKKFAKYRESTIADAQTFNAKSDLQKTPINGFWIAMYILD